MEVMEEGNLMDRVPILVGRDFEYYQKNQTVLSEKICLGVVGGRLDFPKNASFAAVKLVLWWEEEFFAAFRTKSSLFSSTKDEELSNAIVKSSDPDKFFVMSAKSSDLFLEHLHVLAQEALDHADLSVLTATLGASAIIKNSLHCYMQSSQHANTPKSNLLQISYKNFDAMCEAVGERLLDLHVRLLSLYLLQDAGGRPLECSRLPETGSPSIHGWWLYMQGTKQDLWETVPPQMAQRIFAGMLNDTLSILNVRYCQVLQNLKCCQLLVNDIVDILQCVALLLPSICSTASELLGLDVVSQSRDVRDVHAKCGELMQCLVYRGAPLHFVYKAFKQFSNEQNPSKHSRPSPWYTFVNPKLFPMNSPDLKVTLTEELSTKLAVGLELIVLLAQPQPSWQLLMKVIMMRNCHLASILFDRAAKQMSTDNAEWPINALWLQIGGKTNCENFLCTSDGFCTARSKINEDEYAMTVGALTYLLVSAGSKHIVKSIVVGCLESSGNPEWAACLDRRQLWCNKRPSWMVALLALVPKEILTSTANTLLKACNTGVTMYQAMSLCLNCLTRSTDLFPKCLLDVSGLLQDSLPTNVVPTGGSVLLHLILSAFYSELLDMSTQLKAETTVCNGSIAKDDVKVKKHVRISSNPIFGKIETPNIESPAASTLLALAEGLCSIDEDHKHTDLINLFVQTLNERCQIGEEFGLDEFTEVLEKCEGQQYHSESEKMYDSASLLSNQILTTLAGKDSLRVIYDHLKLHAETILTDLDINDSGYTENDHKINLNNVPLLYTMFHIGRRTFDQYLNDQWPMNWSHLVELTKAYGGYSGARHHVLRRWDLNDQNNQKNTSLQACNELKNLFSKKKGVKSK